MAAAPDEGRILIAGRPIADLSGDPYPMLIGLQNLQGAKDEATEAAGSPAT